MKPYFCCVLAIGTALGQTPSLAQVSLEMSSENAPTILHGQGEQAFVQRVEELSGNEIEITLHQSGSLGLKAADNLDAVADGVVDIASTISGVLAGTEPIFMLASLPFVAPSTEDARMLYQATRPEFEAFFEENGQILLYAVPWPASGIFADHPIDSIEALKGLKIRTYDANATRTLIEAKAAPIQLAWTDTIPMLATGGVDAVLTSAEGGVSAEFWEQLSDFTSVNYAMPLEITHMNKDSFERLSPEQQDALLEAARITEEAGWEAVVNRMEENFAKLEEYGMTVTRSAPAKVLSYLAAAGSSVLNDWKESADEDAQAALAEYASRVGREY
ncbi:TRAP transporter substrate-binding protein [Chelativorans alearense]|uniref:TRAP transporter substrate-binding protein n=1 Tax=Chelativorans alearense TaxID=2681495 RepID=UPI0013D45969|nr:TRAP transporter substrate-binding protein [Chelativorans alearense]